MAILIKDHGEIIVFMAKEFIHNSFKLMDNKKIFILDNLKMDTMMVKV
jgi:hypothetical protein